jgi:hypothetical protein
MTDQVLHLADVGGKLTNSHKLLVLIFSLVEATMITSATSKAEKKQIFQRLHALCERNLDPHEKEIKLAYVTVLSQFFRLYNAVYSTL